MKNKHQFSISSAKKLADSIYQTAFEGVYFLEQNRFNDQRGWYSELMRLQELNQVLDVPFLIKQVNSSSSRTRVARGFHAENWNKLITPLIGECLSVLADLRPASKTFGHTLSFELNNGSLPHGAIFVPAGVANSFLVLQGPLVYLYAVDKLYKERDKSGDIAISLFDPDLGYNWPLKQNQVIQSNRDKQAVSLRKMFPEKFKQ